MSAIAPKVYPVTLSKQQAVVPVNPLAGDLLQAAPETSAWVAVPPGSIPQLELNITFTSVPGTFNAFLETCNQVNSSGVAVDQPRQIGWFRQTPNLAPPYSTPMSGAQPCDNYVRVNTTPGAGSTIGWTVTGQLISAAHAESV